MTTATTRPELTRISSTPAAYQKALKDLRVRISPGYYNMLESALDYGAGFGRGTEYLTQSGFSVDAYEPYEVADWPHVAPLYADVDDLPRTYDLIMCVYVLNVLEPQLRRNVVQKVYGLLNNGGVGLFIVRQWENDVARTKTGIPAPERHALYVPHGNNAHTYQKGYDNLDLPLELDWYLPNDVLSIPLPGHGYSAAFVTKGPAT